MAFSTQTSFSVYACLCERERLRNCVRVWDNLCVCALELANTDKNPYRNKLTELLWLLLSQFYHDKIN
jgi:hypothetical protein